MDLSVGNLLSLLRRIQKLQFNAESKSAMGWDGIGTGSVTVTEPAPDSIVFHETGTWQPNDTDRTAIEFKNVFRWSAVDQALRLEHLRFGPDNPVFLFDLAPNNKGLWKSLEPHLCGEDRYTGSLNMNSKRLEVQWTIVGPHKRESIHYIYW